jgi:hypothetical protein
MHVFCPSQQTQGVVASQIAMTSAVPNPNESSDEEDHPPPPLTLPVLSPIMTTSLSVASGTTSASPSLVYIVYMKISAFVMKDSGQC